MMPVYLERVRTAGDRTGRRCGDALDVGCGVGLPAWKAAVRAKRVTGDRQVACDGCFHHPGPSEWQVIGGGGRAGQVIEGCLRAVA